MSAECKSKFLSVIVMRYISVCMPVFFAICLCGRIALAEDVTVSLKNPPASGFVEFILFDSPNTFGDNRDAVKTFRYKISSAGVYTMKDIPAGKYALLVYHDENNNSLMDRNFIGIPKEPLAYANGYRPKGPPSFSKASFLLKDDEPKHFDVFLERPLGEYGRLGVGIGVIVRSSPYRNYNGDVSQVIPAITYMGERLQIYGPDAQLGLIGNDKLRLAATGSYRMGVYDEEESPFLEGMGNAEDTFMAGLSIVAELPGGINVSAGYSHDVLDNIGGGAYGLEIDKTFQAGILRLSPRVGINRMSEDLANNDFGVPADKAAAERPAYELGSTTSVEGGVSIFLEFKRGWLVIVNASVEVLDDEVTDSPIVSEDYVVKGFGVISYLF